MRVEMKVPVDKRKDKVGLALIFGILVLLGIGYAMGTPSVAAHFPPVMEKALLTMRAEIDRSMEGATQSFSNIYQMVAGR